MKLNIIVHILVYLDRYLNEIYYQTMSNAVNILLILNVKIWFYYNFRFSSINVVENLMRTDHEIKDFIKY